MQEVRRYKPSTISRRVAVVAGFYRTCVIDEVLAHSRAEYVRRPSVPPESPTLGQTHLQFEAMLANARTSSNLNDFALVAMLGLLGLRIFEACGANIEDRRRCPGPSSVPWQTGAPGRSCAPGTAPGWTGAAPPAACTAWPRPPACTLPGCTRTCCDTPSSPPCSTPGSTCATFRSPSGT
jgi:hypothetical protein